MISQWERATGLRTYPRSVTEMGDATCFLARGPEGKVLVVVGDASGFAGERQGDALLCPLTPANAAAPARSGCPGCGPSRWA